jgi:hypothetical protein
MAMSAETGPRHLVTVWNPSYADDAMDEHLGVLLDWVRRHRDGRAEADEVHVWWAKLRSPNRVGPLDHASDVLAIQEQISSGVETHLYLTDYRSLYVAHLLEVTDDDVPTDYPDERENMPAYYAGKHADFWFRLGDIRRLVANDTPAVIAQLGQLRNVRYHDRPVSLYGGIVDLPLIVRAEEEPAWFADTAELLDGPWWVEHEAVYRGETERMAEELRDNLLGTAVWSQLVPTTRSFLISAEAVFRARRHDPQFDFSGPVLEYVKAVETEINHFIFPALRRVLKNRRPAQREVRVRGGRLDLGSRVPHQSLGTLRLLLEKEEIVRDHLESVVGYETRWLLGELPSRIGPLAERRNPGAHSAVIAREEAASIRAEVLGIGREGLLVRIALSRMRARSV